MSEFFTTFPELDLGDIVLREIKEDDVKSYFSYISHKDVVKFLSDDDIPKDLEQASKELAYWRNLFHYRHSVYWGISHKGSSKLIGTCGFNNWIRTHRRGEISYDLAPSSWNKGIMTKALRAMCDFAFTAMNLQRIQATVADDNMASMRVLDKLAFQQEARLRHFGRLHGRARDFFMYSLVPTDITF